MTVITLDLPDDLAALLGSSEAAAAKAKKALVLQLLREARISQGRAARLLGLTRYDILDLMARDQIPSRPETVEELDEELAALDRLLGPARKPEVSARGGRQ